MPTFPTSKLCSQSSQLSQYSFLLIPKPKTDISNSKNTNSSPPSSPPSTSSRPGLDSRPLRVSQRSNALQFYKNLPPAATSTSGLWSTMSSSTKWAVFYNCTDPRPWYPSQSQTQTVTPVTISSQPPAPSQQQQKQQNNSTASSAATAPAAPPRHRAISSLVTPYIQSSLLPPGSKRSKGSNGGAVASTTSSASTPSGSSKSRPSNPPRLPSSAASIRSFTSSIVRKRKYSVPPTLPLLPPEILYQIFSYLDQKTLHALVVCGSRRIMEEANYNLYEAPRFATTYRFAQFVTTVSHDRYRANMVRVLDLSNLGGTNVGVAGGSGGGGEGGGEQEGEEIPLAGWREWKFRNDPLHTIRRDDLEPRPASPGAYPSSSSSAYSGMMAAGSHIGERMRGRSVSPVNGISGVGSGSSSAGGSSSSFGGGGGGASGGSHYTHFRRGSNPGSGGGPMTASRFSPHHSRKNSTTSGSPQHHNQQQQIRPRPTSTHPLPSPFLARYSFIRDVPVGAILHVLTACPHLREINLSNISLAADYSITPLGSRRTSFRPTTFTTLLYVSDVPKSLTWQEGDTSPVTGPVHIAEALTKLRYLKVLKLRMGLWVVRDVAERILEGCEGLKKVDLEGCGMYKGRKWMVEGERAEVLGRISEERREEEDRERRRLEEEARQRRLAGIFT